MTEDAHTIEDLARRLELLHRRDLLTGGGPLTSTSFHCAPVMNLYLQVQWTETLGAGGAEIHPFMYPALSKGLNWQSRVDFRNPNFEEAPLYRYVDRYETILEPGDVLWNPPWVWHGVENLTESIAVSMWWANVSRTTANNPVLTPLAFLGRPNPVLLQIGLEKEPTEKRSRVQRALEQVAVRPPPARLNSDTPLHHQVGLKARSPMRLPWRQRSRRPSLSRWRVRRRPGDRLDGLVRGAATAIACAHADSSPMVFS